MTLSRLEMIYLNAEAASAILKGGTAVAVKLGGSPYWYGDIVYRSEGRTVYVALTEGLAGEGIRPEKPVSVKFVNEYFIYIFEGRVTRIHEEYPHYAAIRTASAEEIINGRLSPRYDVRLEARLRPVWDNDETDAMVTDISFGGVAFVSSARFDCNDELDIGIRLYENIKISAIGKIIKKNNKSKTSEYSMQFSNMDESSYKFLSLYFSRLEGETNRMYENYKSEILGKIREIAWRA